MAEYNLGTAHGSIVIDYNEDGTKKAKRAFIGIGDQAKNLGSRMRSLGDSVNYTSKHFGDIGARVSRTMGFFAGGSAILAGLTRATGRFGGSILGLRGGLKVFGALRTTMFGLPKSVQGFPNMIKQILLLSAALKLFGSSSKLLGAVGTRIQKLVKDSSAFKSFANIFPGAADAIDSFGNRAHKSINRVGNDFKTVTAPIHNFSKLIFSFASLRGIISTFKKLGKVLVAVGGGFGLLSVAVSGAVSIIVGAVSIIKQLSGLIAFLPAGISAAVAVFGTLKVGLIGISKAFKTVFGDQQKFNDAIKNLAPSAQAAMKAIRGLKGPLTDLKNTVQGNLFAGMADIINRLASTYIPVLQTGMGNLATTFNRVANQFASFAVEGQTVRDVSSGFQILGHIMDNVSKAVKPLMNAFRDIGIVALQAFSDASDGIGRASDRFAAFVSQARSSGALRNWIDNAMRGFGDLVKTIVNISSIFNSFFKSFNKSGKPFLDTMAQATGRLAAFMKTAQSTSALQNFAQAIGNTSRIFKNVFVQALKALGPIIQIIGPDIATLSNAVGKELVSVIKVAAPILRVLANILHAMAPYIIPIIGPMIAVGAATKGLGLASKLVLGPLRLLTQGFSVLGGVLTFVKNPLLGVRKAMNLLTGRLGAVKSAALSARIGMLYVKDAAVSAGSGIKRAAIAAGNFAKVKGALAMKGIASGLKKVGLAFATIGKSAALAAARMVKSAVIIMAKWTAMAARAMAKALIIAAAWLIANPFVAIAIAIAAAIAGIVYLVITNWDAIKNFLITVWNFIKNTAIIVWNAIVAFFTYVWNWIKTIAITVFNSLVAFFVGIWNWIRNTAITVWNSIVAFLNAVWNGIRNVAVAVFNSVVNFFIGVWNGIRNTAVGVWNAIWGFLSGIFNSIRNAVVGAFNAVRNFIVGVWNAVRSWTVNTWNTVVNAVSNGVHNVLSFIGSLPGKIGSFFANAGRWLYNAGKNIIMGLINGIKAFVGRIWDTIKNIAGKIGSFFGNLLGIGSPSKVFHEFGNFIMQGLINGLNQSIPELQKTMTGVADTVTKNFPTSRTMALGVNSSNMAGQTVANAASSRNRKNVYTVEAQGSVGGTPYIGSLSVQLPQGTTPKDLVDEAMFQVRHISRGVYGQ